MTLAYERWSMHLLNAVMAQLDRETRVYLDLRRQGAAVRDIAEALGVGEESLRNKYGGEKLVRRVRREIRWMVLDLTVTQRELLIRHLLAEAGLSTTQVERLLGVPVKAAASAPVVEEEALLELLGGWGDRKKNNSGDSANPAFEREYVCRHHRVARPTAEIHLRQRPRRRLRRRGRDGENDDRRLGENLSPLDWPNNERRLFNARSVVFVSVLELMKT